MLPAFRPRAKIQGQAKERCAKLPAFEIDLIGKLPTRLLPRSSTHPSSKRGMHLTLPGPPLRMPSGSPSFLVCAFRQHYFGIGLLFPFPYPAHRRSIKAVTRLRPSIPEPKVFQI
jgi:hypothetical protein